MLNLLDQLTELDNKRIENYIYTYGAAEGRYLGNAEYLKYWAQCKPHLFKLLGGKLIHKIPVEIDKSQKIINKEFDDFFFRYEEFLNAFADSFYHNSLLYPYSYASMFSEGCIQEGTMKIERPVKVKREDASKVLQIQPGMKPIRAMQKMIEYFQWDSLKEPFERFRIALSQISNDKKLKGNLCFSIHPLDFLTMSDNSNGWSSCMSWQDEGCYHIGTVEMMNSNNVICCYLESGNSLFNFNANHFKEEEWSWNNKKWRQLFYVTNEIAVGGKAYPYQSKELTLIALDEIKRLSEQNLHRTYSFGPELYKDMIHVGSKYRMDQNREWIYHGETTKHNILFNTRGMYNDMLNDQSEIYWCYRNKVKKNTIITYSGKAPCLCCGNSVIEESRNSDEYSRYDYNDRYDHVSKVVCPECTWQYQCDECREAKLTEPLYIYDGHKYCKDCANRYYKICPDCGKVFRINYFSDSLFLVGKLTNETIYQQDLNNARWYDTAEDYKDPNKNRMVVPLLACDSCMTKLIPYVNVAGAASDFEECYPEIDKTRDWYSWVTPKTYHITKETIDFDDPKWSKYYPWNLKNPEFEEKY